MHAEPAHRSSAEAQHENVGQQAVQLQALPLCDPSAKLLTDKANQPTDRPTNQPNRPTNQAINHPANQSANQPANHRPNQPSSQQIAHKPTNPAKRAAKAPKQRQNGRPAANHLNNRTKTNESTKRPTAPGPPPTEPVHIQDVVDEELVNTANPSSVASDLHPGEHRDVKGPAEIKQRPIHVESLVPPQLGVKNEGHYHGTVLGNTAHFTSPIIALTCSSAPGDPHPCPCTRKWGAG